MYDVFQDIVKWLRKATQQAISKVLTQNVQNTKKLKEERCIEKYIYSNYINTILILHLRTLIYLF